MLCFKINVTILLYNYIITYNACNNVMSEQLKNEYRLL